MKILFTGLSIIDVQMFVPNYPKANTKTRTDHYEISTGGPATNAAITCSFLGSETTLITPVGKHYFTHSLTDSIVTHNVTLIDPIHNIESEPLVASIITDESNGERTIFSFHPVSYKIDFDPELHLDANNYALALFDGFYPGLSIRLLKWLKQNNIPTVLDGGSWKKGMDEILPFIDIAICSNDFTPPGINNKKEIVEYLMKKGVSKIAITRGDLPIILYEGEKTSEIAVKKIRCKDSLGAGDVIHGAFCYFYSKNNEFRTSVKLASEIASFSCLHRGTRSWMHHYKTEKPFGYEIS